MGCGSWGWPLRASGSGSDRVLFPLQAGGFGTLAVKVACRHHWNSSFSVAFLGSNGLLKKREIRRHSSRVCFAVFILYFNSSTRQNTDLMELEMNFKSIAARQWGDVNLYAVLLQRFGYELWTACINNSFCLAFSFHCGTWSFTSSKA